LTISVRLFGFKKPLQDFPQGLFLTSRLSYL
jgi:hypothetical protein